jgi:hypothetical protein
MIKKDPVFWWATGILVLALGLFAVTQNQYWLALMIGSYLLRPTLASLGVGRKRIDERQMVIHYRSGNIAFAVMMIACVIAAIKFAAEDNHAFELFAMAIVIGLATKALFNVVLVKNFREAASKILIGAGLLIALFGTFSHFDDGSIVKILLSTTPGLAIAGVGFLSKAYPRLAGVVTLVATALLLWVILGKGFGWAQIGTAAIVGVPLILAGLCLFSRNKVDSDAESEGIA